MKSKDFLIDKEIEATNAEFPIQVDIATTALSVTREGEVVTYKFKVDEDLVDISTMIDNSVAFKSETRQMLVETLKEDAPFHALLNLMGEAGIRLRYEYKGNRSGKTMIFEFSNNEILEMLEGE